MIRVAAVLLLLVAVLPPTRTAADDAASAPADAIRIRAAGTLRQEGGYYLLTQDVTTPGNGFVIAARGITLDLGGHTLTYGTGGDRSYGVAARHQYHRGTITVRNGRIRQGNGGARASHGIDFAGGHDLVFEKLNVDVHGPDACGMYIYETPTGSVRITGCQVACRTTVVGNRHYPGVAAIRLEDVGATTEIAHNRVTASPQWGIQVAGKGATTTCRIHHNIVRGTKALVANGYMLGVHRRGVEAYANILEGESRGIHVDGVDHDGHGADIHHNRVIAQDQPNAEYATHWCHGIKLEGTRGTKVHHNLVRVTADATHSEARALDLDVERGGPLDVYANRFEGLSRAKGKPGKALIWYGVKSGDATSVRIRENVFVATDVLVWRTWHSETGVIFERNAWLADPDAPGGRQPDFERWDNQDGVRTTGHGFLDPYAPGGTMQTSEWDDPGPYTSKRLRHVEVDLLRAGRRVEQQHLRIHDKNGGGGSVVADRRSGLANLRVGISQVTNGGKIGYAGPFQIVAGDGVAPEAVSTEQHIRGPARFVIELETGRVTRDVSPPPPPVSVRAAAKPDGSVGVTWTPAKDASGIRRYLVRVAETPWQVCNGPIAHLGGLPPGQTVSIDVRAIDGGGNVSAPSKAVSVKIPPRP